MNELPDRRESYLGRDIHHIAWAFDTAIIKVYLYRYYLAGLVCTIRHSFGTLVIVRKYFLPRTTVCIRSGDMTKDDRNHRIY